MTNTAPMFGTEIAYPGGKAVFAELVHLPDGSLAFDCKDCTFKEECYRTTVKTVETGKTGETARPCRGGVYLDKVKYLGLKLVGDIK